MEQQIRDEQEEHTAAVRKLQGQIAANAEAKARSDMAEAKARAEPVPSGVAESRGTAHFGSKVVRELWSRDIELPHFALSLAIAHFQ